MTNEDTSSIGRTDSRTFSIDIASLQTSEYHGWTTKRLVEGYRRNSILLREYGTDERTIRSLCAIEERLRARNIDPDKIVEELDA